MADALCPLEYLEKTAQALALKLLDPAEVARLRQKRRDTLPLSMRLMELPLLRAMTFDLARKEVMKKTGGHYPAPLLFLAHLKSKWSASRGPFLESEAKALAESMDSPVARNLIRIFFLSQDVKKQAGTARPTKLSRLAIVGAGFMGSGIAIPALSRAKLPTLLKDANEEVLGRAMKKIWGSFAKRVSRRQIGVLEAKNLFDLATPVTSDAGMVRADLVIEAVPEILELKKKIFASLEAVLPPHAILASNTSTLPIRDLSAGARNPERFIGMHFFSPAEIMPLVEVIPGPGTSPETLATVIDLALKMGKTPVVVGDSPGFLVNRILLPYILEAVQMVDEGVPVATVDAAAVAFGMPVGPIQLIGDVGVEVIIKVFQILQEHFGDHLPHPAWIEREDFAKAFVREGSRVRVDEALIQRWIAKSDPGYSKLDVLDRLFHSMLNEAARCLDEGVVKDPGVLDLAMIFGTGFPAFRGGLLREAQSRGLEKVVNRGKVLGSRFGGWLSPPQALLKRQETGFYV